MDAELRHQIVQYGSIVTCTIFDCAVLSSTLQAGEMDSVPCSAALAALCVKPHR